MKNNLGLNLPDHGSKFELMANLAELTVVSNGRV